MTAESSTRYIKPSRIDVVFNKVAGFLTRIGISVMGSRVLAVRGRKSGQWRTTPVNLLAIAGTRYLVAPRGQAQWVRNIRVSGGGELRLGRRVAAFTVSEIADDDKVPVLRAYLKKWGWEVGRFFEGVTKHATDDELAAIAPGFPVFRIN